MTYRNYLIGIFLLGSFIKGLAQERYLDPIFSKVTKETYIYSDTLKLDFYFPETDSITTKPLLLLVHGGGFASGRRDNFLERSFCEDMAKRGYSVASISYRLTRKGKPFNCDCPTHEKMETFLMASEDILKATQYLVDRSKDLKFDGGKIVLIGSSAGAEAILNTVFMQYRHDFKKLPYKNLRFSGIISFAGAVLDAKYITDQNFVPTLLFHGKKDNLVPFGTAPHHYCDETSPGFLMLDGSQAIVERLDRLGKSYTLVIDPEGNHDWANLAYSRIDIVSDFIKKVIINGELRRSILKISPNK